MWGLVASTVISALGTIFVANLLGDTNYGLYTIAVAAPTLISIFADWGMIGAMTKYAAQYRAEDKAAKIRSVFIGGMLFDTVLGLVLSVVGFLLSDFLAALYSLPNVAPLLEIASITILASALLKAAQAAFVGMEKMQLNGIAMVVQALTKSSVAPVLVIAGLGPLGAITGYAAASLVAALMVVLLLWWLYRDLPKPINNRLEVRATVKTMFRYGFPLSIATMITAFQTQFYSFILPVFVAPDLIGNYGVANTFVVLITFFAIPVSTVLFPAFSKLDPEKDHETLKNVFQFSVKYSSLLVVPAAAVVMALAKPGILILFPEFSSAPLFLALLAILYFYVVLGNLSVGSFINGQGQTKFSLKLALVTFGIGFPLSIVLISQFGVPGLIVTTLTANIPSLVIALRWLKLRYDVTVDWASSARIMLSGAVAALVTFAVATLLAFNNVIALGVGAVVFFFVFSVAIVFTGGITRADIDTIRGTTSLLGPLRHLTNFLLDVFEKLIITLRPE